MTDPDADPYRTTYDLRDESPSMAVVEALAEATDLEPSAFGLADHVDPGALDALFRPRPNGARRVGGRVEFPVEGHRVVVRTTGEVILFPNDAEDADDADGDGNSGEFDDESD